MVQPHGCPIPLPTSVCGVGGLASSIVSTFFNVLAGWVADAAAWLLGLVGAVLGDSTAPPVTTSWFLHKQAAVFVVAAPIALLALLAGIVRAVVLGNGSDLWRTVLLRLPVAVLLGAASAGLVGLCVSATDQLSAMLAAGPGTSLTSELHSLALAIPAESEFGPAIAVVTSGLFVFGALSLWVELVVRSAAITVATALLPLVFACTLWPPGVAWARRLVETLGALIISKAVIVLVLSIALDAVAHTTAGPSSLMTGGALLLLASLMPFALLRLVPAVETAAVAHLESVRHRAGGAVQQVGRQAVGLALGGPIAAVPSIDPVGSNPVGMMPGVDIDPIAGSPLDPTMKWRFTAPPIVAVPASTGTHRWEKDHLGLPTLVWHPGHDPQD